MLRSNGEKFKLAEIGDTVLIPVSLYQLEKMSSIGQRYLMGHIIDAQDYLYTESTSHETISAGYAKNQFDVCPFKIIAHTSLAILV